MGGPRVVVVGAGLAGLVCAHALRRGGAEVTLLEASARAGGWVHTLREGGYLLEWGPQAFLRGEEDAFARAIDWAGLAGAVVEPTPASRRRFVLKDGALRRVPAQVHRLLSPRGLARAALEPFVPRRRLGGPESLERFARRRFGEQAAEVLFDALASGVFAGDPAQLEVESAFPRLAALERDHGSVVRAALTGGFQPRGLASFAEGMGQLPAALAAGLGEALRLAAPARALERVGEGWRVRTEAEALEADAVVLAIPAFAAGALLSPHDLELSDLLGGLPYADVAVVALGYDAAAFAARPPEGFGFLVPRRERLHTLGCLFPSATFPAAAPEGKVQLRALLGGRRDGALLERDDPALLEVVRRELDPLLGITREPEQVHLLRHRRAIPQYELGHAARLSAIERALARWPGLHLTGAAYRGVSVVDVAADGAATAARILARRAGEVA